jgi:hypothetical protein
MSSNNLILEIAATPNWYVAGVDQDSAVIRVSDPAKAINFVTLSNSAYVPLSIQGSNVVASNLISTNVTVNTTSNTGYPLSVYGTMTSTGVLIGAANGALTALAPSGLSQASQDFASNAAAVANSTSIAASNTAASALTASLFSSNSSYWSSNALGTTVFSSLTASNLTVTGTLIASNISPPISGGGVSLSIITEYYSTATGPAGTVANAWAQRVLNTVQTDTASNVVSLSANNFTMKPGTYEYDWNTQFWRCNRTGSRLQNVTAGTVVSFGTSAYSWATDSTSTMSIGCGQITIAANTTFALYAYTESSGGSYGADPWSGMPAPVSASLYSVVKFRKIA